MAYQPQRGGSYNNNRSAGNTGMNKAAAAGTGERQEPVFKQFVKLSKTGKLTFSVGGKALTIPANTRVTLVEISQKRKDALAKASAERGFKSTVPTHELIGFPIEQKL